MPMDDTLCSVYLSRNYSTLDFGRSEPTGGVARPRLHLRNYIYKSPEAYKSPTAGHKALYRAKAIHLEGLEGSAVPSDSVDRSRRGGGVCGGLGEGGRPSSLETALAV